VSMTSYDAAVGTCVLSCILICEANTHVSCAIDLVFNWNIPGIISLMMACSILILRSENAK